ncbi:MAG: efflux RND transporter periplasmic adaptor subunit [Gemmatimonadota bacterium]|nr:efflux RND transporter periplasmic adaptor subunit [Gemmatimonadota bacterium]
MIIAVAAIAAACSDKKKAESASAATAPPQTPTAAAARSITLTSDQRERLHVVTVSEVSYTPSIVTTGSVAFNQDISTQVLAPISGPVTRILAHPGATVGAGGALALVSSPDFATAVSTFRKALATARQTQRVAEQDSALFKNDAIARRDLEQAQTDALAASADLDASLQELRALGVEESTLALLRANKPVSVVQGAIRSPIAGTVVEQLINPGQLLQAGTTPTFTVADLSSVWVVASVFESDLPLIKRGENATITSASAPRAFTGRVDYVAAVVDPATKATGVRIVVPNTGRLLKKDMYVTVTIRSSTPRSGVLVPVAAVLRDEDNLPFVFVEGKDGSFGRRMVTLGNRVDDRYEVRSGLSAFEKVISEGGLFVQFAQNQ